MIVSAYSVITENMRRLPYEELKPSIEHQLWWAVADQIRMHLKEYVRWESNPNTGDLVARLEFDVYSVGEVDPPVGRQ